MAWRPPHRFRDPVPPPPATGGGGHRMGFPLPQAAPVACEKEGGTGEVGPPRRVSRRCWDDVRGSPPGHMGATPPPWIPRGPLSRVAFVCKRGRGREALHGGGPHAKGGACCTSIRADPRRASEQVRDHGPIRLPCPQGATRGGVAGVTACVPAGVCRRQREGGQVCPTFARPVHLAGSV